MNQFYGILILLFLLWSYSNTIKSQHRELVCGEWVDRYDYLWAFAIMIPLIWMAATRTNGFGDTSAYQRHFEMMPDTVAGISSYLKSVTKDKGFQVLSCLIKSLVGSRDRIYFAIIAFIQGSIVISVYRKYSPKFWVSVFLFLASTDYISWMFNGIRQFMAVTLIFAGTGLIYKKKYVATILLIIFASTMHQSALLMIPVVFIVQGKAFNYRTILTIIVMLLAIIFVDRFTGFLSTALEETQYTNVVSDYTEMNDNGTNPIRVLIYSMPAILSFVFRRWILKKNNKFMDLCINMSVITMGLYALSMVTSGIFLGRLPIYTSLYSYMLLPWLVNEVFDERSQRVVYAGMVGAYLLFYYYQMHMAWGLM